MIATGGTGGHIFPALALGQACTAQGHTVVMVGSGRPLDRKTAAESDLTWKQLAVRRLKGLGWSQKLLSFLTLPWVFCKALGLIIGAKPELIVGFGGASTGPLVVLGRLMGFKAAIVEQNRIPGFTNRLLAPFVHRIFLSFPLASTHWHNKRKLRMTGNPVRPGTLTQFETATKLSDRFTLLIFGGSQGARFLNELILKSLPNFQEEKESWRLIHITGVADFEKVRTAYQGHPDLDITLLPFTDEIGRFYKEADLVIARSGAATISDLIAMGRPSILIPYPFAADNHQEANARYLEEAGAANVKLQDELTPEVFWQLLQAKRHDRDALQRMGMQARELEAGIAEERILEECKQLVSSYV